MCTAVYCHNVQRAKSQNLFTWPRYSIKPKTTYDTNTIECVRNLRPQWAYGIPDAMLALTLVLGIHRR